MRERVRTIVRFRPINGELQGRRLTVLRAADFCNRALESLNVHFGAFQWVIIRQSSILKGYRGHRFELISFCFDG